MNSSGRDKNQRASRRNSERRGRFAEHIAAAYMRLRGHRILDRRFKAATGEIDLVTRKGRRIAFIEVKARADMAACEASITPKLRSRVRRAADVWMARHEALQNFNVGFDIIFIRPRKWPVYLKDGL